MTLTEAVRRFVAREIGERRLLDVDVARAAGVSQSWLSRFLGEQRGTLSIDRAEGLATALGMSLDQLLDGAESLRRQN